MPHSSQHLSHYDRLEGPCSGNWILWGPLFLRGHCFNGTYKEQRTNRVIFKKILFIFREGKGGRETLMWERNLLNKPWLGTEPTTWACSLTGNWTSNLSLCRTMPNQLNHHQSRPDMVIFNQYSWSALYVFYRWVMGHIFFKLNEALDLLEMWKITHQFRDVKRAKSFGIGLPFVSLICLEESRWMSDMCGF